MDSIVEIFYAQEYENRINKAMLNYSYIFPDKEIGQYIEKIVSEPIQHYLEYISRMDKRERILAKDVFQFSKLDDVIVNYCVKLKEKNNPGMKYQEIGKILLNDGKERKKGALVKYGENHAKTAKLLGLSFEICATYFLTCIGYVFPDLDEDRQNKLLSRLILRNKLIIRLYQASRNGRVNAREFLYMLSDSTYVRRRSNLKLILETLSKSEEYDFCEFTQLIIF